MRFLPVVTSALAIGAEWSYRLHDMEQRSLDKLLGSITSSGRIRSPCDSQRRSDGVLCSLSRNRRSFSLGCFNAKLAREMFGWGRGCGGEANVQTRIYRLLASRRWYFAEEHVECQKSIHTTHHIRALLLPNTKHALEGASSPPSFQSRPSPAHHSFLSATPDRRYSEAARS